MYGSLMKVAVDCGRTVLAMQISKAALQLDISNYRSLISDVGRDRDVGRAFEALACLRATGATPDVVVYSCVLTACIFGGDLNRTDELLREICWHTTSDVVSHNTLLDGYCQADKLTCARALLDLLFRIGFRSSGVSYNCLVHAAVFFGPGGLMEA